MATLRMPTIISVDAPWYEYETDLEGQTYALEFEWNDREGTWHLNIKDASGNLLAAGIRVVTGYPLLAGRNDPRLPPGQIEAVDTTGAGQDPGRMDLGSRVKLLYVEKG
jgi:hypothetical protein